MKLIVCAAFDLAVQTYGQPIFVPHRGAARRSFDDEVNRPAQDNPLYQHPDDYELYQLGFFDNESGVFETANELIVRGKDVAKRQDPNQADLFKS